LLLDAKIRRMTAGRASFDDVMRLAYKRYGGERGFTSDEFRRAAEEIADGDLREWFRKSLSTTDELDYSDLLELYGLRFVTAEGAASSWKLEVVPTPTEAQRRNLSAWLAPSRAR
jgi:predicted metalloprotease with PDZ domain